MQPSIKACGRERDHRTRPTERTGRLDSDAAAASFLHVYVAWILLVVVVSNGIRGTYSDVAAAKVG